MEKKEGSFKRERVSRLAAKLADISWEVKRDQMSSIVSSSIR